MADRSQQRGLEHVTTAQRAGLDHIGQEGVAFERGGEQRLERGDDALLHAPEDGFGQVRGQHERRDLLSALAQGKDEPALVGLHRRELDRRRRQVQRCRQALGGDRQRRPQVPPAQQRARHLRREVGLAPALLGLQRTTAAASASALATSAATKKTASATQFSPSAIVRRPVGGRWKKLNVSAPRSAVATANAAPQYVATSSTPSRYTTLSEMSAATSLSG